MVEDMAKDEIDHIIKEVKKTGLSLEVEIASLLEADHWFTLQDIPYFDKEEHKTRKIDIVALKNTGEKFAILVIECKKNDAKPWVFYVKESSLRKAAICR